VSGGAAEGTESWEVRFEKRRKDKEEEKRVGDVRL
jgi:hypothetical protein